MCTETGSVRTASTTATETISPKAAANKLVDPKILFPSAEKKKAPNKDMPTTHTKKIVEATKPTPKTKVATRLSQADETKDAKERRHRSADLIPLTNAYNRMSNRLIELIRALQNYKGAMENVDQARIEVFHKVAALSEKPSVFDTEDDSSTVYSTIREDALAQSKKNNQKYQDTIIDYVLEWHAVVTKRVEEQRARREQLHKALCHYEAKVEAMRKAVNSMVAKGKTSPTKLLEKFKRNEDKLVKAWKEHEQCASYLCDLMELSCEQGYKDLYPVIMCMRQFESDAGVEKIKLIFAKLQREFEATYFTYSPVAKKDQDEDTQTLDNDLPREVNNAAIAVTDELTVDGTVDDDNDKENSEAHIRKRLDWVTRSTESEDYFADDCESKD
jgi:hypothetical protein